MSQIEMTRFADILDIPGGKEKLAQNVEPYIRDKLREDSYAAQIIPPEDVTPAECQKSTKHDGLEKIVQLEPTTSGAVPVTFRGGTKAEYIRAPRIAVPFYSIMSRMFEKTTQELLAYDMPLTKMVEQFSVKDIEAIYDYQFTRHIESGIQAMQTEANGTSKALSGTTVRAGTTIERSAAKGEGARLSSTDTLEVWPVVRPDFVRLMKMLDGYERKAATVLMTAPDYDDILQWTAQDMGYTVSSDTMERGLNMNTLFGLRVVRTIKTRILRTGNVYAFTSPDFLGKFFVMNKISFWVNKIVNKIQFCAFGDVGMCIANIASVAKLELYSADVNPSTGSAGDVAAKTPVGLDELNVRYNRVDEGYAYQGLHVY